MALALAVRGVGGGLIALALVETACALTVSRGGRGGAEASLTGLARWYERSRGGRRLARRLQAADLDISPPAWRGAQLAAGTALTVLLLGGGAPPLMALAVASSMVRCAGWLAPRLLAGRADEAVELSTVELARHLATELRSGASAAEALGSAIRIRGATGSTAVRRLLAHAQARIALGGMPVQCLAASVGELPEGLGRQAMRSLVAHLELVSRDGIGTRDLTRFAARLEGDRRARADARTQVAEVRLSAMWVPLVAICAGALLATGTGGLHAILTPAILAIVAVCTVVTAAAVAVVRRITSL